MAPAKILIHGEESRDKVFAGVEKLQRMVVATMGPKGRNILIERGARRPFLTKDGVSVAREVDLKDPFENMGAQIVKIAAEDTNDAAGDGTTTATLLAYAIMKEGLTHVKAGKNAILVKRGIDQAVNAVVDFLEGFKRNVDHKDQYRAIATVSAQDPAVGEMIADVLDEVGEDGVVTVEASQGFGLEKELVEGMQFDGGYASPYFVNNPQKMACELNDVPVILTDERITSHEQVIPILDQLLKAKMNRAIIIAEAIEGDALATLVLNKMKGAFLCLPVRAPGFGQRRLDFLEDLAALTGATVITESLGKKVTDMTLDDLGSVRRLVVTKHQTTIVEGKGTKEAVETRIGTIKDQLKVAEKDVDKERLQQRIAKLTDGVGIIKVGAATEFEQKELQHRVEDALSAVKAAVEEGIVPGGGVAYLRAVEALAEPLLATLKDEDEILGAQIVFDALPSCFRKVVENAGYDVDKVIAKVANNDDKAYGFNAATGEYGNLYDMQIINPKKVERAALQNAASVAGMFLTLEGAIAEERLPEEEING